MEFLFSQELLLYFEDHFLETLHVNFDRTKHLIFQGDLNAKMEITCFSKMNGGQGR